MTFRLMALDDGSSSRCDETAARRLEATGQYRVLRRLQPAIVHPEAMSKVGHGRRVAIILDTETTGVDHDRDLVVEIAMVAMTYDDRGLHEMVGTFAGLQDPLHPLSSDVVRLTGLSDSDLAGQCIDQGSLEAFVGPASLVIAHNAAFDRRFAETISPLFAKKAWACSMEEIPWRLHGATGLRLEDLLRRCGLFHDAHRALADCHALASILRAPLSDDGEQAFATLLRNARRPSFELRAAGAPFAAKAALKARGYRWSEGIDGRRAWTVAVTEEAVEDEIQFLRSVLPPGADVPRRRLTAVERYSRR